MMVAMLNAPPDQAVIDLGKDYFAASHVILAIWSHTLQPKHAQVSPHLNSKSCDRFPHYSSVELWRPRCHLTGSTSIALMLEEIPPPH